MTRFSLPAALVAVFAAALTLGCRPARAAGFPYDATYPNGLSSVASSQSTADSDTLRFWTTWQGIWIVPFTGPGGGQRVLFQDTSNNTTNETVSEGMGYGMLFCVYFNDESQFDDLYQYVAAHLNQHGLMWNKLNADGTAYDTYNQNGTLATDGTISATDGDEDIAAALCLASKIWGSDSRYNYKTEAVAHINALKNYDVLPDPSGNPVVAGGDYYQTPGDPDFNPSYFAPAWYRIYQSVTGDATWAAVITKGYSILYSDRANNGGSATGLPSQDCNYQGLQYDGYSYNYTQFEYNAIRVPFRTGIDWSWFGSSDGKAISSMIGAFYHTQINTNHTDLASPNALSSRDTNGTVTGGYESGTFTGLAGVASQANSNLSDAQYLYNCLVERTTYTQNYADNIDVTSYYDGAWHLFSALYETGNFPNLYASVASKPAVPAHLTATAGAAGTKTIKLSWTASSGATSYTVYRASTSGGHYKTLGTSTSTTYTNSHLTAGTTYYYEITASNSSGTSAKTGYVSATAR